MQVPDIPRDRPVLIAGPTASGKSALALSIAQKHGGVIVNADASQVYGCWRTITARPSAEEESQARHALYGHVHWSVSYSVGQWIRDVKPLLSGPERPIIIGGTGLYFSALTEGIADIPETPGEIRERGNLLTLQALLDGLDARTRSGIDIRNRARVQRAWEVQTATGRPLSDWQSETAAPVLRLSETAAMVVTAPREWLNDRIVRRFDLMLEHGALAEVRAMQDHVDPALPAFRAIGVPELVAHLRGEITIDEARNRASIATRQFAKRQRTWFRSRMKDWQQVDAVA